MLKKILNVQGTQKLSKHTQKSVTGGKKAAKCSTASDCSINQICVNGRCFNCYDPFTGNWYC